jgi:hypothetical protein
LTSGVENAGCQLTIQSIYLIKKFFKNVERSIFIKEIITTLNEPQLCPTCKKNDRLEKEIIREERSAGKTILCSRCEALIVVTNHNLKKVELSSIKNDIIMLKEHCPIRKIMY